MTAQDSAQGARSAQNRKWLDAIPWLGVAGAALLTYCSVQPWARVVVYLTAGQDGASTSSAYLETVGRAIGAFLARPGSNTYALTEEVRVLWLATVASGVVLGLAMVIWRRSQVAASAYLFWLVITTACFALLTYVVFGAPAQSLCQVNCGSVTFVARTPMPAFWLAMVALTVAWVGGDARLASIRAKSDRGGRWSVRAMLGSLAQPARAAALIVTAGILVWFFGFIFTPWATQGCTDYPVNWYHFVSGSCSGTDSDGALALAPLGGYRAGSQMIWVETYALLMMLAALIAVWQRGWSAPVVTLLWAAPTTWLTGVAISGIPALLANPPRYSYAVSSTKWVTGYGPAVSAIGLALVWAGAVVLVWRAALAWRARTSRQTPRSSGAA